MVDIEEAFQRARDKESHDKTSFLDKLAGIGSFFSEENIDQTARTTSENEAGIVVVEAINEYLENRFGFEDRVMKKVVERKMAISPSRNGAGREDFVRIFQGVELEEQKTDLSYRLIRP